MSEWPKKIVPDGTGYYAVEPPQKEDVAVIPADLGRELYETGKGLADLWREIAPGWFDEHYNNLVDERTESVGIALARYEHEVEDE